MSCRRPWVRFLRAGAAVLLSLLFCLSGVASASAAEGRADEDFTGKLVIEIGWDASRQEVVVRRRCTYRLPAGSEAMALLRKDGDAFCSGYTLLRDGQDPANDGWEKSTYNVTQESPRSPARVEAEFALFLSRRSGPQELEVGINLPGALDGHPEGFPEVWTVAVRAPRWSFRQIRGPVESQSPGAVSWKMTASGRATIRSVVLQRDVKTTKPATTRQQTRLEAAGLAHLYPEAGAPWQIRAFYAATHPHSGIGELGPLLTGVGKTVLSLPDEYVTTTVDVTPWAEQKWAAITAHRGEVARERALPGLLARLPEGIRRTIISTEHFTRLSPGPVPSDPHQLTT